MTQDREDFFTDGVKRESLFFLPPDVRAYVDEAGTTLFTGIAYTLYEDGSLQDWEQFEEGWGVEKRAFYPSGLLSRRVVCPRLSAWRKAECWHENGQRKDLSYVSGGLTIARRRWDEQGGLVEKLVWNDGGQRGPDFGEEAMAKQICSGRMGVSECTEMQLYLRRFLLQEQVVDLSDIHTVAGVDLAYWEEEGQEYAVCCIAVMDASRGEVLERVHHRGPVRFPYLPGYLAFRELPLILETARLLKTAPDVYMFDGNGILHPRKMGIATQASIFLRRPAVGVAKSCYRLENASYGVPGEEAGAFADITLNGEVLGRVLRTHKGVKPVYVSVGNYMSLDGAVELTLRTVGSLSHIPLPTWEADQDTHRMRERYQSSGREL